MTMDAAGLAQVMPALEQMLPSIGLICWQVHTADGVTSARVVRCRLTNGRKVVIILEVGRDSGWALSVWIREREWRDPQVLAERIDASLRLVAHHAFSQVRPRDVVVTMGSDQVAVARCGDEVPPGGGGSGACRAWPLDSAPDRRCVHKQTAGEAARLKQWQRRIDRLGVAVVERDGKAARLCHGGRCQSHDRSDFLDEIQGSVELVCRDRRVVIDLPANMVEVQHDGVVAHACWGSKSRALTHRRGPQVP